HRTALTSDGRKIGRRALGPKRGAAIKLNADGVVTRLTIGEGIETVLAGMAEGFFPCWSLSDASELVRFPILPGIKTLTILVDNDENGRGQNAAIECSRRWTEAGREVFRVVPNKSALTWPTSPEPRHDRRLHDPPRSAQCPPFAGGGEGETQRGR